MRALTAGGLGTVAGALGGAVAAAPVWLVVSLAAVVIGLAGVVLLADRPAQRAVLLITALRGQPTMPRLDPPDPGT